MRILKRLALIALIGALCLLLLGIIAGGITYWLIEPRVPSVASLKDVQMQVPLRILSADGKLIAEFGETRRMPVDIRNVPDNLKHAVLAAEDADFYHHSGIDFTSTFRAAMEVALHHGQKVQGGSTITQQVARNFFLSPQKTYTRKITEILTAFRIENELSKDQILQLYLNKMFLGHRSYGVAAAAQYYYGKPIDQLTVAECAAIASSFQLPSVVNPIDHKDRLIARRNWVLGQMLAHRFIDRAQYQQAVAAPDVAMPHEPPVEVDAPYLAEMVRQQALQKLGNQALTDGYVIRTTLDSHMQAEANHALRSRLEDYDHRHGYRGPTAHVALPQPMTPGALEQALANHDDVSGLLPAIVTSVDADAAQAYVQGGATVSLSVADMKWALGYARKANLGGKGAASILAPGDIIRVRDVPDDTTPWRPVPKLTKAAKAHVDAHHWELEQIPAAQAAMVSLSPNDGAVKALVGGFNFQRSKFNRAVQTQRQPGSSFKPFIYSAAFSRGYTPASIINDAPIALPDPSKPGGLWTPQNDDGKFRGPMRLREALAQSVNLVAIRLLDAVGVRYVREYATRFGFPLDAIPPNLSMALGTASVSPMAMARAYSVFANGGFLISPYYIAEIDNRDGKTIYKADPLQACRTCEARLLDEGKTTTAPSQPASAAGDPGALADTANAIDAKTQGPLLAPRVIDQRNDYLTVSLMRSVIDHGTGAAAKALGRSDLAGKTGSTNDHHDGWFCGFNTDLVTTAWVGFDDYRSLGRGEFGAKTALPIWMAFMGPALKGAPEAILPMPPGIVTATIDATTGLPAAPGDGNTMSEMFKIEDLDRLRAEAQNQKNKAQDYNIF